jgi:hypothetical protein|nr:MAG TPA: hypothetical protein [Caudoviricetes sp.]
MTTKQECEEAINEICKKCFEKHELEYGHQPDTCAFWAFDNEDCPTVKVLKDLIQEHFEEKAKTNYEHFKDEIIENTGFQFSLVDGKPHQCSDVRCLDCGFSTGHGCNEKIKEWLKKPYEKQKYKLSRFEYDLLNAYKVSGILNSIRNYSALFELYEKGYFKDVDLKATIVEILDNCEVI